MKKSTLAPLRLAAETVRPLVSSEMRVVLGGRAQVYDTDATFRASCNITPTYLCYSR